MADTPRGAQRPGTSATLLEADVTERAAAVVVRLAGEVDATNVRDAAAVLDNGLSRALRHGASVILDLTEVTFFASVGLNLLVTLSQRVQDHQLVVRLAVNESAVLRPLQLMGLGDLFPVYSTVADALGAPATGG